MKRFQPSIQKEQIEQTEQTGAVGWITGIVKEFRCFCLTLNPNKHGGTRLGDSLGVYKDKENIRKNVRPI